MTNPTTPADPVASDDIIGIISASLIGEPSDEYMVANGYVRAILARLNHEIAGRKEVESRLAASEARSKRRRKLLDWCWSRFHASMKSSNLENRIAAEIGDVGPAKVGAG